MEPGSYRNARRDRASVGPTATDFLTTLTSAVKLVRCVVTRKPRRAPLPSRNHGIPRLADGFPWGSQPRRRCLGPRRHKRHLGITALQHHAEDMRTTVNIDDDVLKVAKSLATQQRTPLGRVISDLMRKGLQPVPRILRNGVFPVFPWRKLPACGK